MRYARRLLTLCIPNSSNYTAAARDSDEDRLGVSITAKMSTVRDLVHVYSQAGGVCYGSLSDLAISRVSTRCYPQTSGLALRHEDMALHFTGM